MPGPGKPKPAKPKLVMYSHGPGVYHPLRRPHYEILTGQKARALRALRKMRRRDFQRRMTELKRKAERRKKGLGRRMTMEDMLARWSYEDIAEATHMHPVTVSGYLRGEHIPTVLGALAISRFIGVPLEYFAEFVRRQVEARSLRKQVERATRDANKIIGRG